MAPRFKHDDLVIEFGTGLGLILQSGEVSYDVIWVGGMTSRYRYATGRHVRVATEVDLEDWGTTYIESLRRDAAKAREERRTGAGIKRSQVSPSH